jgi:hypothetical protein
MAHDFRFHIAWQAQIPAAGVLWECPAAVRRLPISSDCP